MNPDLARRAQRYTHRPLIPRPFIRFIQSDTEYTEAQA